MTEVFQNKLSLTHRSVPLYRGNRFSHFPAVIWPVPKAFEVKIVAYAKSWTDKYNDGWYLSLKLHERGLWDQLFTYAKMVGDTGRIIGRSWSAWGSLWGCDGRTCRKIVTKMHDDGKVVLNEHTNFLELEIVNYEYYQRLKKVEDNKSQAKMPQKCSLKQTRADQSRPEQDSPSVPTTPKGKKEKEPDNIPYLEIISDLNEVLGTKYREKTEETRRGIRRWWKQGFRLEDFKAVHRIKKEEWKDDPKMSIFLRPSTLYGPKFEDYLNQTQAPEEDSSDGLPPRSTSS